jgi:hypothetical protein
MPKPKTTARQASATTPCSPIRFNINHDVRVKLTRHGEDCLKKNYEELAKRYAGKLPWAFQLPESDSDGWTRYQMHDLMAQFGPHLYCGAEIPFETEIEILPVNS